MTAAGTAAARPLARAANLGRFAGAALGRRRECPPSRRTPRYPTLAPNLHVREIPALEPGCPLGLSRPTVAGTPDRPPRPPEPRPILRAVEVRCGLACRRRRRC